MTHQLCPFCHHVVLLLGKVSRKSKSGVVITEICPCCKKRVKRSYFPPETAVE